MSNFNRIVIVSGPSGSGKSTIIKRILELRDDAVLSISTTTRLKRDYESEGQHYYFVARNKFLEDINADRFIEWAEVHGEYYGTLRDLIEKELSRGNFVMMDIDVHGGENIRRSFPDALLIFLDLPSVEELRNRLKRRGTDSDEAIEKRLSRYPFEAHKGDLYDYKIINDDLDKTVAEIQQIMDNKSFESKSDNYQRNQQ